jgi:hypothetical protein
MLPDSGWAQYPTISKHPRRKHTVSLVLTTVVVPGIPPHWRLVRRRAHDGVSFSLAIDVLLRVTDPILHVEYGRAQRVHDDRGSQILRLGQIDPRNLRIECAENKRHRRVLAETIASRPVAMMEAGIKTEPDKRQRRFTGGSRLPYHFYEELVDGLLPFPTRSLVAQPGDQLIGYRIRTATGALDSRLHAVEDGLARRAIGALFHPLLDLDPRGHWLGSNLVSSH